MELSTCNDGFLFTQCVHLILSILVLLCYQLFYTYKQKITRNCCSFLELNLHKHISSLALSLFSFMPISHLMPLLPQEKQPFERIEVTRQQALEMFSDNQFKVDMFPFLMNCSSFFSFFFPRCYIALIHCVLSVSIRLK